MGTDTDPIDAQELVTRALELVAGAGSLYPVSWLLRDKL